MANRTAAALLLVGLLAAPAGGAPAAQWKLDQVQGAVFYEIFVRSFSDSDGDGIGDFKGLTAKLDYLNDGDPRTTRDLGVEGIWLMPVFPSPSYHGYDVADYEHVNPEYGTDSDFDRFLSEAHRRGIRVILDLVLNHTSDKHPWFRESAAGRTSPRRDWYVWSPEDPGWGQPWNPLGASWHPRGGAFYYGLFWSGMPDLNLRNRSVREELERIAEVWLRRGVDGFRLDATRHLIETGPGAGQSDTPETHRFLREFAACVRRTKPEALLVGENWTDAETIAEYFGGTDSIARGDELPCNFDFPVSAALLDGLRSGDARGVAAALRKAASLYPAGSLDAPFLTNHDMTRVATQLRGNAGRLRCAAGVLLTLPGVPFLYYGEEVGLRNGPGSGDEHKRTPMPWNASRGGGFTAGKPWFDFAPGRERANVAVETGDPRSLLPHYRKLIRVRKEYPAIRTGDLAVLTPEAGPTPALAFERRAGRQRMLVLHNLGDRTVTAGPYRIVGSTFRSAFLDGSVGNPARSGGAVRVKLGPYATGIWRIE